MVRRQNVEVVIVAMMLMACSFQAGLSSTVSAEVSPPGTPVNVPSPTAMLLELPGSPTPGPALTATPYDIQITPPGVALPGSLLLSDYALGVAWLNLAMGHITPIFQPPSAAYISSAVLSPDRTQILMAYSPPPTPGQIQFGYTQLYLLPADGSSLPEPLIPDASPGDLYTSPLWAPDGNSIYFAHYVPRQSAAEPADYRLERMSYPEGESEVIAHQVFALAVSADGVRIAYVTGDPVTLYNGLFVANADGTDTTQVVPPETFLAIDAVAFSPDGQNLVFSGAANGFGFPVSWHRQPVPNAFKPEAHSIPEELWRTPVEGGSVQMLTRLGDTGYRFSYSPEGDFIAFSTFSALYVMNPDGSGLTILYPEGVSGSLQWLPE